MHKTSRRTRSRSPRRRSRTPLSRSNEKRHGRVSAAESSYKSYRAHREHSHSPPFKRQQDTSKYTSSRHKRSPTRHHVNARQRRSKSCSSSANADRAKTRQQRQKTKMPINLLRKLTRERRQRNELTVKTKKTHKKRQRRAELSEEQLLVRATETALRSLIENTPLLSDVPYDATPEELLGEIAIAKGHATTIYIERDGLSTLTIVLPQKNPTIANLKRAIETTSKAQMKRELRQRLEERQIRRMPEEHTNQQVGGMMVFNDCIRSTGELVYSNTRNNGHEHRPNVSWRFLWRAFALYNVVTRTPVNDENGRKLLSECDIENASTLKFCKREKYFGRKRV